MQGLKLKTNAERWMQLLAEKTLDPLVKKTHELIAQICDQMPDEQDPAYENKVAAIQGTLVKELVKLRFQFPDDVAQEVGFPRGLDYRLVHCWALNVGAAVRTRTVAV